MASKKKFTAWCVGAALVAASSAASAAGEALYVYSTIDAFLTGAYDGDLTVRDMSAKGNFGLGTFNRLDGEMIVLDGICYHVRADGSVTVADPSDKIPLVYVVPFVPSSTFEIGPGGADRPLAEVEALIDARLPNKNLFYAVEVKGDFTGVTTRAIAPQVRPYRPLSEVAKTQVLFKREAVSGSLVGFRSPGFSKGVSVPGWHWHFISTGRDYGGHVISGGLSRGVVKSAAIRRFDVELPSTEDFANADQTQDRSKELHQVETGR